MRYGVKPTAVLAASAALSLSILAACGGSDGNSGTSSSSGSTSPTAAATPASMTGTVAVGNAVSGADVTVIGANGTGTTATSDASGNYTASLTGLTAPFVIMASDPAGVNPTLVSVVASLPTGTSAPVVANVTTLTTAVAALLTTSGNPLDLTSTSNLTSLVTTTAVGAAVTKLDTALTSILTANGLSATSFDPIGTAFTANQTGADAVIDAVSIAPAPGGGTELVSTANPSTAIALNQSTTVSAPLQAPPAGANYLATLTSELAQCVGGTLSACSQAIDANYLENGFTSFAAAHPGLAASGVTLGSPQTLYFFKSGAGTQQALIQLPYTTSNSAGSAVTVVQKTSSGNWDIIGNAQAYNVTITSFLARKEFLDAADAAKGRYEAGIGITIPVGANGTPNPSTLASVSVTGPGINGTAWLEPRAGTGNTLLALTTGVQSGAPTGGATSTSNTSLYRWSWTPLPGDVATTPQKNNPGFYNPAGPIDVSTVPAYSTYQVTFYDSTGTQIGQPISVMNTTPPIDASAGAGVAWQALSSDFENAFLNPSGSLAGAQPSASVSWSNLVNNQNIAPLVTSVQIQTSPGTGVSGSEVDGWWVGPATFAASGQYTASVTAGVDQRGVQECTTTACPFPALQTGGGRTAQLSWGVAGTAYYNIWRYDD